MTNGSLVCSLHYLCKKRDPLKSSHFILFFYANEIHISGREHLNALHTPEDSERELIVALIDSSIKTIRKRRLLKKKTNKDILKEESENVSWQVKIRI